MPHRITRRIAVLTAAALAVPLLLLIALAAPAAAHNGGYCGHTSTSHWGWYLWGPDRHTVTFEASWTDRWAGGKHQHRVKVASGYGSYLSVYPC